MFVVVYRSKNNPGILDEQNSDHIDYLNEQFKNGNFIASGKINPPDQGGIIIANVCTKDDLLQIISKDPFYANEMADYDIFDFTPSMACEELEWICEE